MEKGLFLFLRLENERKRLEQETSYYLCTMIGDEKLKTRWHKLHQKLSEQFADGEAMEMDAILYLIGVQELGQLHNNYQKDDKINLMHIAICRLLEPLGYYEFDYYDDDGWPHYKFLEALPPLKGGEQSVLIKEAMVNYFLEKKYIS